MVLPEHLNKALHNVTKHSMEYFVDQETLERNQAALHDEFAHSDAEVNFSLEQYTEFLFYHLAYFMLLGPAINILILLRPKLRFLFYNMEFFRANIIAFIQALYWAISTFIMAGFFWYYASPNQYNDVFDSPLLKTVVTSMILRTTSIAGKYATYPKMLIKKYKCEYLDKAVITKEFMLIGWLRQGATIIQDEVECCVERLEMDPEAFKISFMSPISQSCEKALDMVVKDHETLAKKAAAAASGNKAGEDQIQSEVHATGEEVCSSIKPVYHEYQMSENKTIRYYSAEYIFEVLVQNFNKTVSVGRHMLTGWCLGIIWSFVPSLLRLKSGQNFHGTGAMAISATYLNGLLSAFLFFVQFMFYIQAIVDMRRKYYLMCQLGYMMSPKMIKMYPFDKYLPTVSILDRVSLLSWYNLRRMSLDYGRKYFYRHEVFLPINLLLLGSNIVGFFAVYYLQMSDQYSDQEQVSKLLLSCFVDGMLYLVVSFHFMYSAGRLNDEFAEHLRLVQRTRAHLSCLRQNRHFYFGATTGYHDEDGLDISQVLLRPSTNFLYLRLRDEFLERLAPKLAAASQAERDGVIKDCISRLMDSYDSLLQELEHELTFEQVKILGNSVTKSSVINLFVGIASVVFKVFQLLTGGG
jgi:hypothetical protein